MIGDSLDADVQGALDMGLDAILIRIKFKWNKK
jgi:ribonucleotide monophosphatase NagD (HAD superfamily)